MVIDSLQPAGAETSLLSMAPHLGDAGIDLEVAHFGRQPGLGPKFERLGVPVTAVQGSRAGRVRQLRQLVRSREVDLVHTTLFEADIAGRLAARWSGVPVVSSLVNVAYGPTQREALELPRWKVEGARALDLITARLVSRFHAVSGVVASEMGERLRIVPDRIEVIPRGRDRKHLGVRSSDRRARVRRDLGISPTTPVIVVASRHERQKGVDVAIDAFAIVRRSRPDTRLLLAGREGNATPEVQAAIERAGARSSIDVLGLRDDVPDLLAASDVFLFPSRWEGLGSVLIEAMALEIPVVASDLPVLREILVDDDGTELAGFAPVGASAILAERCLDALGGQRDLVARAHARYERVFTSDRVARRLADMYRRAVSG